MALPGRIQTVMWPARKGPVPVDSRLVLLIVLAVALLVVYVVLGNGWVMLGCVASRVTGSITTGEALLPGRDLSGTKTWQNDRLPGGQTILTSTWKRRPRH